MSAVVLSKSGWVRAAKGHEIDPRTLSYKTGDEYRACARGRSTQFAVFLDSTGRAYSLLAHTLPSARGQGEPLSGRLDPPDGATFPGVLIGDPTDRWVLASSAGYGFVVKTLKRDYARVTLLPDALTVLAVAGREVPRIEFATGVLPIQPQHPMNLAQRALPVTATPGGRATFQNAGRTRRRGFELSWQHETHNPLSLIHISEPTRPN